MSYAMRKTPRSSFMFGRPGMGEGPAPHPQPSDPVLSPPFNPGTVIIPSGVMPMTPSPPASSGVGQYALWGGLAYLAYLLWSKE